MKLILSLVINIRTFYLNINYEYFKQGKLLIEEAFKLASMMKCKLFIPTHFNCFVNNSIDPKSIYEFLPKDLKMKCEIMECNSYLILSDIITDVQLKNFVN